MMPLVYGLWREVLTYPTTQENKLTAICAILQVYSALLGMTDDDFKDLTDQIGSAYRGPLPDGYSEEVIRFYEESKSHE